MLVPEISRMASKNKRSTPRLEHEILVAYKTVDGFLSDWAVNLSQGGLFINTKTPQPVGAVVKLIISLPDTAFPYNISGRVMRINAPDNPAHEPAGMAIEFLDLDEAKRSHIERFVDTLRKALPSPAKK